METKSVPPLKAHLGFWLRLVSNQVSGAFAAKLAGKGVSVAEWAMMRELYDGARPPSEIALALALTRGAITKLADKLTARGLLARAPSARDGRGQILSLTGQGKSLVRQLAALADRNDAEFFAMLDGAEREALMRALRKVAAGKGIDTIIPTA